MRKDRKIDRLGEERLNNQGCIMTIDEYVDCRNIIVEFQDEYKAKVHTNYGSFTKGQVKNPYAKTVCGVGIVGKKYSPCVNRISTKEYNTWRHMLGRCFDEKWRSKHPTYKDVVCHEDWLYYPNFYEWLHSQENFNKWYNNENWNLDKDILIKGNKIYSSDTCCLVPNNVNSLFTKHDTARGIYPIGVAYNKEENKFRAQCNNPFTNKRVCIGRYNTLEEAFQIYKEYKENIIKQVAQIEYDKGNITKKCYNAMISYEIEITD